MFERAVFEQPQRSVAREREFDDGAVGNSGDGLEAICRRVVTIQTGGAADQQNAIGIDADAIDVVAAQIVRVGEIFAHAQRIRIDAMQSARVRCRPHRPTRFGERDDAAAERIGAIRIDGDIAKVHRCVRS